MQIKVNYIPSEHHYKMEKTNALIKIREKYVDGEWVVYDEVEFPKGAIINLGGRTLPF